MSVGRDQQLQSELEALLQNLRAFARSLAGTADRADDLVQETLVKAWQHRDSFAVGSNLKAWLFTILRNAFLSQQRKKRFEVQDQEGELAARMSVPASQTAHMDALDFSAAFAKLAPDHREALILIGAEGFSYEDAALMCGCAVGTLKSRVNRARNKLAALLEPNLPAEDAA